MAQQVLTLHPNEINDLINEYSPHEITRNAAGVRFAAKKNDVTITVYHSGKILFQGRRAKEEASRWKHSEHKQQLVSSNPPSKKQAPRQMDLFPDDVQKSLNNSKGDQLPPNLKRLSVIGSDETGTGDFFGPVTVAACYVPAEQIELIETYGVKDSKQLTDAKMREIAPYLQETLIHSVLTVRNPKYNEIQQRGYSQGKIKALLHNQAISHVLNKMDGTQPQFILIDQFAKRDLYYRYLQDEKEVVQKNVLFATKAESIHIAVAAASILARVAFLEEMDRLSKLAKQELPKGAGPKVDEVAAQIILKSGESTLKTMTKWHFANLQKAKILVNKKRM